MYNLAADPDESYDVAPDNPGIVSQMKDKIAEMVKAFPEEVQKAYAESVARKTSPGTAIGAYPRPAN